MHPNPDTLALLALGEDSMDAFDRQHLGSCPLCQAELAELVRAVDLGRRASPVDAAHSPSPQVWLDIRRELGMTGSQVVAAPRPPRRKRALVVLAAALALVASFGAGLVVNRASTPVASAPSVGMNALPGWAGASGRASVETDGSGQKFLVVQVDATPKPAGSRFEVWMSDTRAFHMMPMGYLTDGQGRFPIPAGLEVQNSPIIDVSDEPPGDTDPTHSNNSVVRGRLPV